MAAHLVMKYCTTLHKMVIINMFYMEDHSCSHYVSFVGFLISNKLAGNIKNSEIKKLTTANICYSGFGRRLQIYHLSLISHLETHSYKYVQGCYHRRVGHVRPEQCSSTLRGQLESPKQQRLHVCLL